MENESSISLVGATNFTHYDALCGRTYRTYVASALRTANKLGGREINIKNCSKLHKNGKPGNKNPLY